ncbi:DJ-1/PfpI family protein [Carboxylicivirga linearis]|uniref:DJ-1/PfpI family protein n=1 Tax=Carboxylicivirga linearis TaxID=1628157 RepID=A0ABS5JYK9_9BACT|nr:DJ-1/PfpI family protein [Carboxylicivirga linearis]MBS2100002.1 DJ-1/PfpI family protein [Carboxylicivirga linearis]
MKKILLLLADGFEIYEASVFIDVMGWNLEEGDNSTQLFTGAIRKEIKSSFNQRFIVDYTLDEVDVNSFDALAIPGGFEVYGYYNDAYDDAFLNLIREFKTANKIIATVCAGALPTGKSGILKGKDATVYDMPKRREALKSFGANVIHQPIVIDDNIITSWNPSTAIDVALLLLEWLTSKENTNKVRKLMGF